MATTKIKCPVEGVIDLDRLPGVGAPTVRSLIDAPELQRLRDIKQLGFSELVYPGATHTRFAHSLGAFQGAQRTMRQLRAAGADIPDEWFIATALACLLHDLGHGPFSHTFESVAGRPHEERTREIVQRGPTVPARLEEFGDGTRQRVMQLLGGQLAGAGPAFLADLVSSALDCDRMDYLRRDALHTGAHYGVFDRDWLIRAVAPSADGSAVYLLEKGRSAVEQYLIGRYHMFQNVYLHKTSRGFETAFRGLCCRLQSLGADAAPEGSRALAVLLAGEMSLDDFLGLHDAAFLVDFDKLVDHDDATVRLLARALRWRRPLRARTVRSGDPVELQQLEDEHQSRREAARKQGLDPDCAVWRDAATDVPYQPYAPDGARKGLRILRGNGLVDVTEMSPTIAALAAQVVVHRLYWVEPEA